MVAIRKINFFEVVLLIVGISVGIVGFMMINSLYQVDPVISWDLLGAVFLWLILIVILILAATMEDVKEELAIVIREHIEETKIMREDTRLLKQINNRQLEELVLLRKELARKKK